MRKVTRDGQLESLRKCENIFAVGWTSNKKDNPPDVVQVGDIPCTNLSELMHSLALGIGTLFDGITDQTEITFSELKEWLDYALDERPERGGMPS